jgi:rare lipoprotein A
MRPPSSRIWTLALLLLAGCATTGTRPAAVQDRTQEGVASYYAERFHGRSTASGETYDKDELTAAHRTLAFGTKVRVTNLRNGKSVVLRITDRGPYARGRIIDVSERAARQLGFRGRGTARVRVEVLRS